MQRVAVVIAIIVLAALGGRAALDGGGGTDAQRARIIEVIDGDTVKVRIGARRETVRLIGIDTPETRRPGTPVQCGGRAATRALRDLALTPQGPGRRVRLVFDSSQDRRDRFGRLLAYVELVAGGNDLGEEQLRAGWADVFVFEDNPFERLATYEDALAEAREAGRGLFRLCPVP